MTMTRGSVEDRGLDLAVASLGGKLSRWRSGMGGCQRCTIRWSTPPYPELFLAQDQRAASLTSPARQEEVHHVLDSTLGTQ